MGPAQMPLVLSPAGTRPSVLRDKGLISSPPTGAPAQSLWPWQVSKVTLINSKGFVQYLWQTKSRARSLDVEVGWSLHVEAGA
jgi:hypothetical protein